MLISSLSFSRINLLRQKPLCLGPISTDPTTIGDLSRYSPCVRAQILQLWATVMSMVLWLESVSFPTDNNM
jgi:hypothetical protein